MTRSPGLITSIRAAQRWPKLWAWVVALLVAVQFGLLFHQSQHHLNPDLQGNDDCVLCQVVAGMGTAPAGPMLVLPVFVLLGTAVIAVYIAPEAPRIALPFHSRAPPASPRV